MNTFTFLAALTLLGASTILAASEESKPRKLGLCSACHQENGRAVLPEYPNLCGQNEEYMVLALRAYRSGERRNAQMRSLIGMLTEAEMRELSRWYSRQRCE
jgi:cytochrome c553